MENRELYALCIIVMIVSSLGFVVENIWLAVTKGYMDNRNMYLPFLLGYGLAVMAIYFLFGTPDKLCILGVHASTGSRFADSIIYLFLVSLCISVVEILLGTFVEKFCGIIWWDYSRLPLHITRYTTIPTSIGFALFITVFMGYFFEPIKQFLMGVNPVKLSVTARIVMASMLADFFHTAVYMFKNREFMQSWHVRIGKRWKLSRRSI